MVALSEYAQRNLAANIAADLGSAEAQLCLVAPSGALCPLLTIRRCGVSVNLVVLEV